MTRSRPSVNRICGAVLGGGQSRRMGGQVKALLLLRDKPLIQHVAERFRPQVWKLYLSVSHALPEWVVLDIVGEPLPVVPDLLAGPSGAAGPLVGLLSVMEIAHAENPTAHWLVTAPCDAPFVPSNLAARLVAAAESQQAQACSIFRDGELHPTFTAWRLELLPMLRSAVTRDGMRGLKQFLTSVEMAQLTWKDNDDGLPPFFNVNTPKDLAAAHDLLDRHGGPIS